MQQLFQDFKNSPKKAKWTTILILHLFLSFKLHVLTFKPCIKVRNLLCMLENLMTRLEFLTILTTVAFFPSPHQCLISLLKIRHYCKLFVFFFFLFFHQEPRFHYSQLSCLWCLWCLWLWCCHCQVTFHLSKFEKIL